MKEELKTFHRPMGEENPQLSSEYSSSQYAECEETKQTHIEQKSREQPPVPLKQKRGRKRKNSAEVLESEKPSKKEKAESASEKSKVFSEFVSTFSSRATVGSSLPVVNQRVSMPYVAADYGNEQGVSASNTNLQDMMSLDPAPITEYQQHAHISPGEWNPPSGSRMAYRNNEERDLSGLLLIDENLDRFEDPRYEKGSEDSS